MLTSRITSKPQYVLHPLRAAARATYRFTAASKTGGTALVELPWGLPLTVDRQDAIGYSIRVGRVFDPAVTEALFRLIEPGDTVVDAGANIGYLSSVAAVRAGASGQVLAFEPHPGVFGVLRDNIARWTGPDVAPVTARRCALSDAPGVGKLAVGPEFHLNMGLGSLAGEQADADHIGATIDVDLARLDDILGTTEIGLLKVDVEGHEPELLAGTTEALAAQRIRDIVYEDHEPFPSRASEPLTRNGYRIFAIDNDLLGIRLLPPEAHHDAPAWPGPSYLATRDPDRALARSRPRPWLTPGILPMGLHRMLTRPR